MAEGRVDAHSGRQKRDGKSRGFQDAAMARINASVGRDPLIGRKKGVPKDGRCVGLPRAAQGNRQTAVLRHLIGQVVRG